MPIVLRKLFNPSEIKSIAKALGDTSIGLTGSEISHLLLQLKFPDDQLCATKWIRLYNAFSKKQNIENTRVYILEFIRLAMKPANFIDNTDKYENLKSKLNTALAFSGLEITESGSLESSDGIATTLEEAEVKASSLKLKLKERDIHPDVLRFCRAELLQNNYFHAVLEAVKSVFDKLRQLTGLIDDGHELANKCLGGTNPILYINHFQTKSEKMEQSGFNELIKGVYSMFRNPVSHEAKINWKVTQFDAEDLLTLVSMIHRRIDSALINKS